MSQILASVQKIVKVSPIIAPDGVEAHSVEMAQVLGWECVVKKNSFKEGDLAAFFEIGSVCPFTKAPFVFTERNKGRIKSARFLGQLSQGLALPLSDFSDYSLPEVVNEGDDITKCLGVIKYEPPEERNSGGLNAHKRSNFPDWAKKTDEIRFQSVSKVLEEFKALDCDVIATLKMDGSSATYGVYEDDFHVCSRNQSTLDTEDNRFWQIARRYNLEEKLKGINNIYIQGECCGPSIQRNKLALKDYDFFMFNAYDLVARKYLDYDDMAALADKLGVKLAPLIYRGRFIWETIAEVVEYARGSYAPFNEKHPREGLVFRSEIEKYSPALRGRLSIKAINNDFLLKIGE